MNNASYASASRLSSLNTEAQGLYDSLTASASKLTSYANSANSARTQSVFNDFKDLWDSEKSIYDANLAKYEALGETYDAELERYGTLSKSSSLSTSEINLPNFKDENQWRAGSILQNAKGAGGFLYNPTDVSSIDDKPIINDEYHMLNGSLLVALNSGFNEINNQIKGAEFLDLFAEDEISVHTYRVSINITNNGSTTSRSTFFTTTNRSNSDSTSTSDFGEYSNYADMTTDEMAKAYESIGLNLMSPDIQSTLVSFTIENIASGDFFKSPEMSIRNFVISSMITTAKAMVSSVMTSAISKTIGLTTINSVMALNVVVGMVIGELTEMALGLDNSFGFGGEYDAEKTLAMGISSYSQYEGFMGIATLVNRVSYALGISDTYGYNLTTRIGSLVGYYGEATFGESKIKEAYNIASGESVQYGGSLVDNIQREVQESLKTQSIYSAFESLVDPNNSVGVGGFTNNFTSRSGYSVGTGLAGISGIGDTGGNGSGNHGTSSGVGGGGNKSGSTSGGGTYSCFVAGTKVKRFNKGVIEDVNIEDVLIDDILIGDRGIKNRVLEYDRPISHGRPIYGFNGGIPFTTTEHMFLTKDGWKALIPEHAEKYHKETFFKLGMSKNSELKVGDMLKKYDGSFKKIRKITKKEIPYDTPLYNFKLDGDNTYIANGYVVHNK